MKKFLTFLVVATALFVLVDCIAGEEPSVPQNRIIVLDPGHFHAGLLQMNSIENMNDTVSVYAPEGPELNGYLYNINYYNTRKDNPTKWVLEQYVGDDYLEKMLQQGEGNTVVISGNNKKKTRYIYESINAGYNVLADKPMAISKEDFVLLEQAYDLAEKKGLVLYELMTERYDVYNVVERALLHNKDVFGELQTGSAEQPAIEMQSVHYFCRLSSSGKASQRPVWYYDVEQQGEGIADVTTHLIDLVQWSCFPGRSIVSGKNVVLTDATHWPTLIKLEEYALSTGAEAFPDYLHKYINKDGVLEVMANGELKFVMKGVNVGIKVEWGFLTPQGGGGTSQSIKRGSRATIEILQSADTDFKKNFYVVRAEGVDAEEFDSALQEAITSLNGENPYITLTSQEGGRYLIEFSKESRSSHENHFAQVVKRYFRYLDKGKAPAWERNNALSKYWITTEGVALANSRNESRK